MDYAFISAAAVLMLLSALLSAGRAALVALPDSSAKKMASSKSDRERLIARLLEQPERLTDSVSLASLACLTAASILLWGLLYGQVVIWLAPLRAMQGVTAPLLTAVQIGCGLLVFGLIILLTDTLCRQLPARLAVYNPQQIAGSLVYLCRAFSLLVWPFVRLNQAIAGLLARVLGGQTGAGPEQVYEEEIRMLIDAGNESGVIEKSEKDMINNIFEFDDRCVSEVMTHRTDMVAIPDTAPLSKVIGQMISTGYSRIPVYEGNIDRVIGVLHVKDLLCFVGRADSAFQLRRHLRRLLSVPENLSCVDLLAQFKQRKVQIALVIDEYGGTAGIVTMEDLLESIVGSMQDEFDDEEEEIQLLEGETYMIDGAVSIGDVERLFDVELDEKEESDYDTIGGLLIDLLDGLPDPQTHPCVELAGIRLTVWQVSDRRIARVRAERILQEREEQAPAARPVEKE